MRFACIREMTRSWKMLKNHAQWQMKWQDARRSLKSNKRYRTLCAISWFFFVCFWGGFFWNLFFKDVFSLVTMMLNLPLALYFGNLKQIMVDDATVLKIEEQT